MNRYFAELLLFLAIKKCRGFVPKKVIAEIRLLSDCELADDTEFWLDHIPEWNKRRDHVTPSWIV